MAHELTEAVNDLPQPNFTIWRIFEQPFDSS